MCARLMVSISRYWPRSKNVNPLICVIKGFYYCEIIEIPPSAALSLHPSFNVPLVRFTPVFAAALHMEFFNLLIAGLTGYQNYAKISSSCLRQAWTWMTLAWQNPCKT